MTYGAEMYYLGIMDGARRPPGSKDAKVFSKYLDVFFLRKGLKCKKYGRYIVHYMLMNKISTNDKIIANMWDLNYKKFYGIKF
jgi:hypothetical protein